MNTPMRTLTVLALTSLLYSGSALAGPSFNTDEPLTPANGGEASGPSFNSDSTSPAVSLPSTVESPPAEPQPAQEFVESKAESPWLTYSINPLYKRFISSEAGQTEGVELEFSLPFTNRSEDRVVTALKDVQLVLACTVETPSGKANVEIRHSAPMRKLKKQRGPGKRVTIVYKLKADESCVLSKDEGVTWEDIALKLPSDWWGYKIKHQYSVTSQKY